MNEFPSIPVLSGLSKKVYAVFRNQDGCAIVSSFIQTERTGKSLYTPLHKFIVQIVCFLNPSIRVLTEHSVIQLHQFSRQVNVIIFSLLRLSFLDPSGCNAESMMLSFSVSSFPFVLHVTPTAAVTLDGTSSSNSSSLILQSLI